jgi:sulfonate transport system substrate-binding protein
MKSASYKYSRIALLAVLLTAPAATFGADANPAVIKSTAVAPKVPSKERIAKIGLSEVTAVGAEKGFFQEEYAKYNAKPEFVNITQISGVSGAEASLLDRGDLDITVRMAYPALQHKANGLDAVVIWEGINPHPRRATTIVLESSNIKSVADLKGKKYGSSLIGCPYYAGVEAFKAQGVSVDTDSQQGDIRFVNITGVAAVSAFLGGKFDIYGTHPATASVASLIIQNQVREITTAVPDGVYVTGGGRQMYFAMRKWANENPDLVKAFLVGWDRTVRWLNSDDGAHWDEASRITARALREPVAVALYDIHDESTIQWSWGVRDYQDAVDSVKRFQAWNIANKDPFYTKHHLSDKEIEAFVDKRFFAGGEYFVDTSEHPQNDSTHARVETPADGKPAIQLAQASNPK